MSKKAKTELISIRFDKLARRGLQKEADSNGLDLATYIRHLLFTHPKRLKNKK